MIAICNLMKFVIANLLLLGNLVLSLFVCVCLFIFLDLATLQLSGLTSIRILLKI